MAGFGEKCGQDYLKMHRANKCNPFAPLFNVRFSFFPSDEPVLVENRLRVNKPTVRNLFKHNNNNIPRVKRQLQTATTLDNISYEQLVAVCS